MIVKFSHDKFLQTMENVSKKDIKGLESNGERLQPGRLYVVRALYNQYEAGTTRPGFMLKWDENIVYPLTFDSRLFEIVDPRLSRWWVFHAKEADNSSAKDPQVDSWLAIPEWDWGFYAELVDGEPDAVEIFSRYEQRMEWEWPRPDVSLVAEALEDCWVMCPECTESWEVDAQLALTQCFGCRIMLENPYWVDPSAF